MFNLIFGALIVLALLLFVDEKFALGWHRQIRKTIKNLANRIQD